MTNHSWAARWFPLLFGVFLGIALIKFGNPVVLDPLISLPTGQLIQHNAMLNAPSELLGAAEAQETWWDRFIEPWPIKHGLFILLVLSILGFTLVYWRRPMPRWLFLSAGGWIGWQVIASATSINPELSKLVLPHFIACSICGIIGWGILSQTQNIKWFWWGLTGGYLIVLWHGFSQYYGGLAAVRDFLYAQPNWTQLPDVIIKRYTSNRIFSTLVYPNALAGAILLLLPPTLMALWQTCRSCPNIPRGIVIGFFIYANAACLAWSGSKAGWLIALIILIVMMLHVQLPKTYKIIGLVCIVGFGLTGFTLRYAGYFSKGATSVGARLDYWRAAVSTTASNPLLGTGPGTFSTAYSKIKPPDAEMARLTHNDYLEQASDSGLPGFLSYLVFIGGSIVHLYRYRLPIFSWQEKAMGLGFLGWAIQGLVEFGLYIPALAWPAFTFLGWMLGTPSAKKN